MDNQTQSHNTFTLRQNMDVWYQAVEAGDFKKLASFMIENVVALVPQTPAVVGKDNVLNSLRQYFSRYRQEVAYRIKEIIISGSLGIVRIEEETMVFTKESGEVTHLSQKSLFVFFRDDKKGWKLARFMGNLNQPVEEDNESSLEDNDAGSLLKTRGLL